MLRLKVTETESSERLDVLLTNKLPKLTRSFITNLIKKDQVTVNGLPIKAGYKLKRNDMVAVAYDISQLEQVPDITIPILYEDNDCLVIDKPAGVLTHSKGALNLEATVATFISPRIQIPAGDRAGIVHRLDRPTSGIMICSKNSEAHSWLQKQFSGRKVSKTYEAVVSGKPNPGEAIIDIPIERHPKKPQTFRTSKHGKSAQTRYSVVSSFSRDGKDYSYLSLSPVTGRTHQLRVHLSYIGHPIVGDNLYGGEAAERMMLHAATLEITLPSRKRQVFTSPLPKLISDFTGS